MPLIFNTSLYLNGVPGSGGSVDESKIIVKSATIPTADADHLGAVYQYVGETDANYTHGYIYECVESGSSYVWERLDVQPSVEIGRYLSTWNCTTGLASTNPPESPYVYKTGDYFLVSAVNASGTNYKPSGTQYVTGQASTAVESSVVSINDTYLFDGTSWMLLKTGSTVTSINGQTGAVSIKSVNGNSLMGSGDLELSTYLPYPSSWHTTSSYTTAQFCSSIASDTSAVVGKAYLGEVTLNDLPQSMINAEVVVEIMDGTTSADKVIVLTATSGNTAPYMWKYSYWNGGSNVSGWIGMGYIDDTSTSSTVATWSANKIHSSIPTVNDATLTITQGGLEKGIFTANASTNTTIALDAGDEIDNKTITKNSSDQLQVEAIINQRTGTDVLSVWQGTQAQWETGGEIVWDNWQAPISKTSDTNVGNIRKGDNTGDVIYGNGVYISFIKPLPSQADTGSYNSYYYSTDGVNWSSKNLPGYAQSIAFGGGIFFAAMKNSTSIYTSTDGENWTTITVDTGVSDDVICSYANGRFFICPASDSKNGQLYSTDGTNWTYTVKYGNIQVPGPIVYGNNIYFSAASNFMYTSSDGLNWTRTYYGSATMGTPCYAFGNGIFVAIFGNDDNNLYTSTDGLNWTAHTIPSPYTCRITRNIAFGNGLFVVPLNSGSSHSIRILSVSSNGSDWSNFNITNSSGYWANAPKCAFYANDSFFVTSQLSTTNKVVLAQHKCYTLTASPTTSTQVYSEPGTQSALTITSVGTGTITLSDTLVYSRNSAGDETEATSVGEAHPDWICYVTDDQDTKANVDADNFTTTGKSTLTSYAFPSSTYDNLTWSANPNTQTAPADGFMWVDFTTSSASQFVSISVHDANDNVKFHNISWVPASNGGSMLVPVLKGDIATFAAGPGQLAAVNYFRFIYAQGEA